MYFRLTTLQPNYAYLLLLLDHAWLLSGESQESLAVSLIFSSYRLQVINLLEKEGLQWRAENQGTLVIKLDGCTQFSFLDSDSDAE